METAALAQVAFLYKLNFISLRRASDIYNNKAEINSKQYNKEIDSCSQKIVGDILRVIKSF